MPKPPLQPTANALADAVQALYRIRAVESPPGPDGFKTVWHQCALGADLVSTVNGLGQVTRQEFTLLEHYFVWAFEQGLSTGKVLDDSGRVGAAASALVEYDHDISAERVSAALDALCTYTGDDKYIRHVMDFLNLASEGEISKEPATVTRIAVDPNLEKLARAAAASVAPKKGWLSIAIGLFALAALGALLLWRR